MYGATPQRGYQQQQQPPPAQQQWGQQQPPPAQQQWGQQQQQQQRPPQQQQQQWGGQQPPPQQQQQQWGQQQPGANGIRPQIMNWFQSVDTDRSGQISCIELQQALMNGDWSPFNPETCRIMIGMFDQNGNGLIDVNEFSQLWAYIENWKTTFQRYDKDRSGNINGFELESAFKEFGYKLSQNFVSLCLRVFDRKSTSTINFDDFIQCCVTLKCLTEAFRGKDVQQRGQITIGYEEFLNMALNNSIV